MRIMSWLVAMLFCAAFVQAETLEGLSRKIDDIQKGNNTGNQIEDLRVRDDATVGDDLTVTDDATVGGDLAVTGAGTVTGKTQADGELEANADVDVNLGAATEEVDITQTNTVGQADTPLVKITDARTGANANATNEATLMISAEGTYGLAVTKGQVDLADALNVGSTVTASDTIRSQSGSSGAFRLGYTTDLGWTLNTTGGGATLQLNTDYAGTGTVARVTITSTTMTVSNLTALGTAVVFSALPTTTNGFSASGSGWNSNGYFCVWTP